MTIVQSLKVKAEEADVLKKELEGTQAAFKAYKETQQKEDRRVKELVDDIRAKQTCAAEDVKLLREKNDKLKKELASHPKEGEMLRRFRGTLAYYNELNDRQPRRSKYPRT